MQGHGRAQNKVMFPVQPPPNQKIMKLPPNVAAAHRSKCQGTERQLLAFLCWLPLHLNSLLTTMKEN